MIIVLTEFAIGLTAGLVLTIWFAAMLMAGEKIAQSSGLGFAMQVDPMTGASTPAVSPIANSVKTMIMASALLMTPNSNTGV